MKTQWLPSIRPAINFSTPMALRGHGFFSFADLRRSKVGSIWICTWSIGPSRKPNQEMGPFKRVSCWGVIQVETHYWGGWKLIERNKPIVILSDLLAPPPQKKQQCIVCVGVICDGRCYGMRKFLWGWRVAFLLEICLLNFQSYLQGESMSVGEIGWSTTLIRQGPGASSTWKT